MAPIRAVISPSRPISRQPDSRLLTLLPELRNLIYEKVLTVTPNDEGHVPLTSDPLPSGIRTPRSVLAILQTCRQISHEAYAFFYWANRLHVKCQNGNILTTFASFLGSLSTRRRHAIVHLAVDVSGTHPLIFTAVVRMLQLQCPNIKSARIDIIDKKPARILCALSSATGWIEDIMSEALPHLACPKQIQIKVPRLCEIKHSRRRNLYSLRHGVEAALNKCLEVHAAFAQGPMRYRGQLYSLSEWWKIVVARRAGEMVEF